MSVDVKLALLAVADWLLSGQCLFDTWEMLLEAVFWLDMHFLLIGDTWQMLIGQCNDSVPVRSCKNACVSHGEVLVPIGASWTKY